MWMEVTLRTRTESPATSRSIRHRGQPQNSSPKRTGMKALVARVWRMLAGSLQWRLLWLKHAKFMVGVTGVVRDTDGNVLLLRHRL